MKKITLSIVTSMLLLTCVTTLSAKSESLPALTGKTNSTESAEANALIARLHEIKAMDMSKLSPAARKELRKEVRSTKARMRDLSGGVYISAGVLVIILILIILL
jgi:hypothetical protein